MHCEVLEEKSNGVSFRDECDLPNSIIVTNVPPEVFSDEEQKANFSSLFTEIESDAHFDFLRSFRRVRVIFRSAKSATAAKLLTQHLSFNGTTLKAFFAQKIQLEESPEDNLLKLPPLEKQFLISPPASPPVGWEQSTEMAPVVCNFDLMARLAAFTVEDTYEIFGGDDDKPKIIVQPATESDDSPIVPQGAIGHTARPPTPRPTHKHIAC